MVNAWLQTPPDSTESTSEFVARLFHAQEGLKGVGGFSLVCGLLRRDEKGDLDRLAVVSNRTSHPEEATWIGGEQGEVYGLSNSAYDDPWPKVKMAEDLLRKVIDESVTQGEGRDSLIEKLLALLDTDTLPKRKQGETLQTYLEQLRRSIFIPPISGDITESASADVMASAKDPSRVDVVKASKQTETNPTQSAPVYGTQKQTVILVDHGGHVTFLERTRFDEHAQAVEVGQGDRMYEFDIDGWAK